MMIIKKTFSLGLICILTITTLIFSGCSTENRKADNLKEVSNTTLNKDAKTITDNDLINSDKEDSNIQLDSIDTQSQQLSTDEIDLLLNDNNDLDNISSDLINK